MESSEKAGDRPELEAQASKCHPDYIGGIQEWREVLKPGA